MSRETKAEQEYWLARGEKYLTGVSERIRTMSLGTLVLIWGLLTASDAKVMFLGKRMKVFLLSIALTAVLVLLMDLLEYFAGYQASRQRAGDRTVFPKQFGYDGLGNRAMLLKQIVGILSLTALILALGAILVNTVVQAQSTDQAAAFFGHWCGPVNDSGEYLVLDIKRDLSYKLVVELDDDQNCTDARVEEGELKVVCGQWAMSLKAKHVEFQEKKLDVTWHSLGDPPNHKRNAELYNCKRR